MEERYFVYGKYNFHYFIFKQDRKTVSLTVTPRLKIVVKCPKEMDEKSLNEFLKKKYNWTARQIDFFKKFKNKKEKEYISGESVLYLGRQYKLVVKESKEEKVLLKGGELNVFTSSLVGDSGNNKLILNEWYNKRAKEVFAKRLKEVFKKFDYDFEPILVMKRMSKKWGSFSGKRKITLNPRLIQASRESIDYVLIHELCHFKYRDHGDRFFRLLESKICGWEKVKEKLEMRFL